MNTHKTDIVILGAGIGGYEAFRSLTKRLKGTKQKITIVDRNNYFTFVPMLHEAAAGSIEPHHCAVPLRELVHKTPHTFIKAEVQRILPEKKLVHTDVGNISYEYCITTLGSRVNYFNVPGAKEYTYHVRSLNGALALHHDLIELLEDVEKKNITLTVVGGGFTGVEVAGQFCDFVRKDIKKLYPEKKCTIQLIESGDLCLKLLPEKVRKRVTKRLKRLGVKLHLKSRAKEVSKDGITLSNGKKMKSDVTVWTTGFENIAGDVLEEKYTSKGRIPVTAHLTSVENDHLYAIGDIMYLLQPDGEIPYPQLAEAAHKEGMYVAKHISRRLKGKKTKPFVFKPKGVLMPVGDWYGVLIIKKFILFGPLAWWIRRTVYLQFMPGLLRKIKIAIDWTLHGLGFRYTLDTFFGHEYPKKR